MKRIRLRRRPWGQWLLANGLVRPNQTFLPGFKIAIEGAAKIPAPPVIFALNHTDRYNYMPFQYELLRRDQRYCTNWVKGKYYEHPLLAKAMEWTNNIPAVSRGYLISRDFTATNGRRPTNDEYDDLRIIVDANAAGRPGPGPAGLPPSIFEQARSILGYRFDPACETYATAINNLFTQMMQRFVALNGQALKQGLDLLVFPQGSRSRRLSRGHSGLAQIALFFGATIVPVGCNGSDLLYPGSSPWARRGTVTYRVGESIFADQSSAFALKQSFVPFSAAAERRHQQNFQGLVDLVMHRIEELLDEPYRFSPDRQSQGVQGTDRFL